MRHFPIPCTLASLWGRCPPPWRRQGFRLAFFPSQANATFSWFSLLWRFNAFLFRQNGMAKAAPKRNGLRKMLCCWHTAAIPRRGRGEPYALVCGRRWISNYRWI